MKKQYMAPAVSMTALDAQQIMAASVQPQSRLTTVEAEPEKGWNLIGVKEATAESTFSHGQGTGANTGNRAKYDVWDDWDD